VDILRKMDCHNFYWLQNIFNRIIVTGNLKTVMQMKSMYKTIFRNPKILEINCGVLEMNARIILK
jgi:hypothetical protein